MVNDNFIFLKDEFPEIYNECEEMEDLIIDGKYNPAISSSRHIIETVVNNIFDFEPIKMTSTELNTKITILYREHITTSKINGDLHEIRKIANKVIHDNIDSPQASAISIHQLIYNVTRFFYEKYNNTFEPVKVKPYSGIDFKKGQMDIDEIQRIIAELQRQQDKLDSNSEDKDSIHEKSKIDFKNYKYTKINGSYLNGELYKLKDSSQEAVESLDKLTDFKKYLHVERDIQNELKSKIEESVNNDTNKLILLCGSVGDGKSHLLSYLIETYPDLMNKFEIINDATESSDPNKTSIDRLSNKLIDFNDENINKNNKKLILSINLGVLNNFIESDYAKKDYIKLSSILNELNIFDVNDFSNNFDKDPVSIISFSDNILFEFNLESNYNVSSKYMSELFNRITQPSEENPFYNAFCKDLNNNLHSPIIYNYSLFSIEEVQDVIINNLIKIIIKYKKIISTRELLNFIYEIIVPSYYEINSEDDSFFNYMTSLLPNLFFNTTDGCEILKFIHYEDPINKRSNIVDQLLMDLNVSDNMLNILEKYIELDKLELFKDKFNTKIIIRELKEKQRNELVTTIIRILNIFGKKEVIELFTKESYKDYVNYLIHYNKGEINQLRHLRNEIEDAILTWKGKIQDNYICIEHLNKFKIAKPFNLQLKDLDKEIKERNINRFKTVIHLKFSANEGNPIDLNLDYSLYEVITKLNKGYKPNKSEQKDLLLFNEFIDKLLNSKKSEHYLILNIQQNIKFKLNEEWGYYNFERV